MSGEPHDPFDVEHLDGHTLEQLSDYLDAGRFPRDPSIEDSAGCQIALAALERLRASSWAVLDAQAADADREETWIAGVMASIALDAHAGRDIPLPHPDPRVHLAVTEGAVRELVRSVGDALPGMLIGRVRLTGEVETAGAPVVVEVSATVRYGTPIPEAAERLRTDVREALERHTALIVDDIIVTVTDIHEIPEDLR